LRANINKIYWFGLSTNSHPDAVTLLRENPDKIHWGCLSYNTQPTALALLLENPEKIDWKYLSCNKHPDALEMLRKNSDKIDWSQLSTNPSIFHDEYPDICRAYFKDYVGFELIARVWHPRNIHKFADWGYSVE
jgi:hypothetical protein